MTEVDEEVLAARLMLSWIAEPGSKALFEFVAKHGPVEAWERLMAGRGALAQRAAARLAKRDPEAIVAALREKAQQLGATILVPESPRWPSTLDDLVNISVEGGDTLDRDTYPPHALWLRGPLPIERVARRSVAIVGARSSTSYGSYMASELSSRLGARGWVVISGGAYGIDAQAHRGVLATGGRTVAVLACGVDRAYPPGNAALFDEIAETGLLLSEWPPGFDPHRVRFLIRNRVIAALARGTILVEAALRSGARQTFRRSRQLGRILMVVPGPATSEMSAGCHEELRKVGELPVRLVARAEHALEEIGAIGDDLAATPKGPLRATDLLTTLEKQVYDATSPWRGTSAARIAESVGLPITYVLTALPALELRGYIERNADGTYRRSERTYTELS